MGAHEWPRSLLATFVVLLISIFFTPALSLSFLSSISRRGFTAMASTTVGFTILPSPLLATDSSPDPSFQSTHLWLLSLDDAAQLPGSSLTMGRYPDPVLRRPAAEVPTAVRPESIFKTTTTTTTTVGKSIESSRPNRSAAPKRYPSPPTPPTEGAQALPVDTLLT
ncbi:hypothetical protein TL16_g12428 [Triparma laevis f. inornata]|uniref:Uncharacterized protein n=2 Tax=Triparma laevis TaxID=1534972 RepID=A0A9W7FJX6_9STRA|nr:hypothetical protein TL16_g12428 [Triparma laevis f. inornata]GMI13899.1 hypothetical protein TrLO_g14627 [Triparma laevis f. longispina]